jgi:DNA-3-methyladenine glycosylase II
MDGTRPVRYDAALACRELAARDRALARLMERAGRFTLRLKPNTPPFEALLESIVHQQLHGRAARTIHDRVRALFAGDAPTPETLLQLPDGPLRAAGLSANKLAALRDLAQKSCSGAVPALPALRRMADEEIVAHLTEVRGIGVWTVEMLLIFYLGRPDVLPVKDYGVRKGFALTFGKLSAGASVRPQDLPDEATLLRRAERWRPWRSVASWYLWRACDLAAQTGAQERKGRPAVRLPQRARPSEEKQI